VEIRQCPVRCRIPISGPATVAGWRRRGITFRRLTVLLPIYRSVRYR